MAKSFNFGAKKNALFNLWAREADAAYERLERELLASIESMRINGVSDKAIFQQLSSDLESRGDVFSKFSGELQGKVDDLLNQTAQLSAVEGLDGESFIWVLDPTVQEHCSTCLDNSQAGSHPFEFWADNGLPGMGTTECGIYCRCSLERG